MRGRTDLRPNVEGLVVDGEDAEDGLLHRPLAPVVAMDELVVLEPVGKCLVPDELTLALLLLLPHETKSPSASCLLLLGWICGLTWNVRRRGCFILPWKEAVLGKKAAPLGSLCQSASVSLVFLVGARGAWFV